MSEAILAEPLATMGQFDAFLDAQGDDAPLWEPVAGRIVAMPNSMETHELIVSNIGALHKLAMDPQQRRVYRLAARGC